MGADEGLKGERERARGFGERLGALTRLGLMLELGLGWCLLWS